MWQWGVLPQDLQGKLLERAMELVKRQPRPDGPREEVLQAAAAARDLSASAAAHLRCAFGSEQEYARETGGSVQRAKQADKVTSCAQRRAQGRRLDKARTSVSCFM